MVAIRYFNFLLMSMPLLAQLSSSLTVPLGGRQRQFCLLAEKEPSSEGIDKTLEVHYDVSGQGADEVEMRVYNLQEDSRQRIHGESGKTDGYYETDFT